MQNVDIANSNFDVMWVCFVQNWGRGLDWSLQLCIFSTFIIECPGASCWKFIYIFMFRCLLRRYNWAARAPVWRQSRILQTSSVPLQFCWNFSLHLSNSSSQFCFYNTVKSLLDDRDLFGIKMILKRSVSSKSTLGNKVSLCSIEKLILFLSLVHQRKWQII